MSQTSDQKTADDSQGASLVRFLASQLGIETIPEPVWDKWGRWLILDGGGRQRCFCFILERPRDADQTFLEIFAQIQPGDHCIIALAPAAPSGFFTGRSQWKKMRRMLAAMGFLVTGLYGVDPSPREVRILFDLQKNILAYVELVSFRHHDDLIKHSLKKLLVNIHDVHSWKGWKIAAVGRAGSPAFLEELSDRFIFLTPGRSIALVFDRGGTTPAYVEKRGEAPSLRRERQNHSWGRELLGKSVPGILDFSVSGETAILRMEYITERNLNNIVAQSLLRRAKLESETMALLDFFYFVFGRMVGEKPVRKQALPDSICAAVQEGLDYLFAAAKGEPLAQKLYDSLKDEEFPLIPQHGDFCVRNILYRDSGGKVLIDWEDSDPLMLPQVDLGMLRVSLADTWAGFSGGDTSLLENSTAINGRLTEIESSMCQRLNISESEWPISTMLSLAYLVGVNVRKGRGATAARISGAFRSRAKTDPTV